MIQASCRGSGVRHFDHDMEWYIVVVGTGQGLAAGWAGSKHLDGSTLRQLLEVFLDFLLFAGNLT